MKNSFYATHIVDALLKAAEQCDPEMINEFLSLSIDANTEHLNLIEDTLPLKEVIRRQRVISQGTMLLALFNHFATHKMLNEAGLLSNKSL